MTSRKSLFLIAWLAVIALALGACSDSSTTPDDNDTDTTAPLVQGTIPSPSQVGVATNALITVTFNEAMNQASATGQVTLSSGGAPTITWVSDRVFTVSHATAWAEGVQVTATLGTGLTDVAGNGLAAAHQFSFFTETSQLLVVDAEPANGATGVNRSASLRVQFSLPVDEASLAAGIVISDNPAKTTYPFTVSYGNNNWYTIDPTGNLPAGTLITVQVLGTVHVLQSPLNTLGTAHQFSFTTGVDVDTTPPTIVSFSPASGATTLAADIGSFSITFSEPINLDTLEPVSMNMEFAAYLMDGTEPSWSEGNTVLTVALPVLPAGLEMVIVFNGFADLSGNVQGNYYTWEGKVAGNPVIYPMTDGLRQDWAVSWSRGPAGSSTPTESGSNTEYRQVEVQGNGDVHVVDYDNDTYTTPRRWDMYDRLASSIEWLGFGDSGGEGGTPSEIIFSASLKFLPLPMVAGTWNDNATVTVPGEGTYTATFSGRVIAREDLDLPVGKSAVDESAADKSAADKSAARVLRPIYYKGAWKVARSMDVHLDGVWFVTMSDTTWYSPTLGPVHEITREDSAARGDEPAGWYRTEGWSMLGISSGK
jgi:methionine-rich copper-binding protein CopC